MHSHLHGPTIANCIPAFLCGIPHISTQHDRYTIEDNHIYKYLLYLAIIFKTEIVCVSYDMMQYYMSVLPKQSHHRIHMIHNAPIGNMHSDTENVSVRHTYGIDRKNILILTVSRLAPIKRVDIIIEVLDRLPASIKENITLAVIGDGSEKDTLVKTAYASGVNTIFTGEINSVSAWHKEADIYMQLSNSEGLSRSIIEATSHVRIPVNVNSDSGSS